MILALSFWKNMGDLWRWNSVRITGVGQRIQPAMLADFVSLCVLVLVLPVARSGCMFARPKNKKPPDELLAAFVEMLHGNVQRFENCLRRRALWKPTFLRSTSRESRVTKPAFDSAGFRVSS